MNNDVIIFEYNQLVLKLKKFGWKQVQGDLDPYSFIIKKFMRSPGYRLLPDILILNLGDGIISGRIAHHIFNNKEIEYIKDIENIVKMYHGFEYIKK